MNGIIWVRVSTEMQTRGYSQDYQQVECERAAKTKGIKIEKTFRVDETATRWWKRRDFKEMTQFLQRNKGYHLLVYTIDRLLRNFEDYVYEVKPLINNYDTSLFWVERNSVIDKKSPFWAWTELERSILEATSEGRKISERTVHGMLQQARSGWYPALAPIGYLNFTDPETQKKSIILDSERAPLVKKAFELYATGDYSLSTLRDELIRLGLTTKKSRNRPSLRIAKHGLEVILRNPFPTGRFRWQRIIWDGKHPRLISDKLFNQVQTVMDNKNRNPKGRTRRWFPFRSFLRCGYCGSTITAYEGFKNHTYYMCMKTKNDKTARRLQLLNFDSCPLKNIRQERIDKEIANEIANLDCLSPDIIEQIKQALISTSAEDETASRNERRSLESRLTQEKNKKSMLYDDKLAGHISLEFYLQKQKELDENISAFQILIEGLEFDNHHYREQGIAVLELLKDFKNIYLLQDFEGKAKILSIILERGFLKNDSLLLTFAEPFGILMKVSQLSKNQQVIKKKDWGE